MRTGVMRLLALGLVSLVILSIFTLSLTASSFAEKMLFFLAFGLGFGVPLLAISLVAEGRQRALLRLFTQHYALVSRVAGIILIAVGVLDLAANLPFLRLYLGV